MPNPDGNATGICPNCRGAILLTAASCASCGALFDGSAWKPIPRDSADAGAENAFEHYIRLSSEDLSGLLQAGILSDSDRRVVHDELRRRGIVVEKVPASSVLNDERKIRNYANWSPLIILAVLGLKGAVWLVVGWFLSRYAASKFLSTTRVEAASTEKNRFPMFLLYHSMGLILYAGVLRPFLR